MRTKQALAVFGGAVAAQLVVTGLPLAVGAGMMSGRDVPATSWEALAYFLLPVAVGIILVSFFLLLLPFRWLAGRGWLTLWSALAVGAVAGPVTALMMSLPARGFIDFAGIIGVLSTTEIFTLAGALGGWAAWRWMQRG